jgi:uncharacterized membrane protein YfcA
MKQSYKKTIIALCAATAGLCNSMIGAGGGIILSLAISKLFSDDFEDKRNIYVNSQAAMIPGCALSCLIYSARGMLGVSGFSLLAIPAVIGGLLGSMLLPKIKAGGLKTIFALLVIWSGYRMITA